MEYNRNYGYLTDCREVPITFPPQHQDHQPELEYIMTLAIFRVCKEPAY